MARSSSAVTASSYHDRARDPRAAVAEREPRRARAPQERQRPIVGDSTSTRSRATTRAAAASSSAAARSIVTPPTPGYCSANQRRMLASRPACSASSSDAPRSRAVSRRKRELRPRDAVAGDRERERRRGARGRPRRPARSRASTCRRARACARARASRRWTASSRSRSGWSDSTASQLSMRPLAKRDAVPRGERGVELRRGSSTPRSDELRPDPRLVDDAVAAVAAGERDVRLERRLDELGIGRAPRQAGEHADVPALDEAEAAGAAGDLRELPRQEVAPLLAVELRRLREEQRLAREVHAVAEHVGRDADLGRHRRGSGRSPRAATRAASRRRGTATRPGWSRFTSPASASTARRLNATTTVPVASERSVRARRRTRAAACARRP